MDSPTQAQVRPEDIVIAVMGPNGSGKSHFIDVLTRQPGQQVSQATHTDGVQVTVIQDYYCGHSLALADLPGFDNTTTNDLDILYATSEWLRKTYQNKIRLTGILYMHRITDSRMGPISLKSLRFLGEICGDVAMTQITLVTTMWDRLQGAGVGESREGELRKYFWKTMLDKGSQMERFDNTYDSGKVIIDGVILRTSKRETLLLQQELVDLGKCLGETGAGQVLYLSLQQLLDEQRATMEKLAAYMEGQDNPHLLEGLRKEYKKTEQDRQKTLDDIRRLKAPWGRRMAMLLFAKGKIRAMPEPAPGSKPKRAASFSQPILQDRLHALTLRIVKNAKYRAKAARLMGNDAQCVADYLNEVLHEPGILASNDGKYLLDLLCELAKSAKVYPQCYVLRKGIQSDSQPVKGGGFADVYKGKHGSQTICLKVIRVFQKQECIDVLRECMKETIVCAHLSHPNILPFYGIYLLDDPSQRVCLVSPWMKNGNLWDYLRDNPSTPRIPLIMGITKGLRCLHQLNIVHGDLKAQNVLLSDDGRALIADFGLSLITVSSAGRKPSASSPGGTTRWTAPELLKGDDCSIQMTKACDIWSFGCLCYEVLTRRMPFYQYNRDPQVIAALLKGNEVPIRPPSEAPYDEVDDQMWNLMGDCWNYQPQDRPTCDSIRDVLTGLTDTKTNHPQPTPQGEDGFRFWEAMRAKSDDIIEYEQVEKILLRIQQMRSETG